MNSRPSSVLIQAHRRLTLLFSTIVGLVLIVMTGLYLYVAESALYDNSFAAFEQDVSSLAAALEQEINITRSWLSQIQADGSYLLYLTDNDIPLAYTAQNPSYTALFDDALAKADALAKTDARPAAEYESGRQNSSVSFLYTAQNGERYLAACTRIAKKNGQLKMLLLSPLFGLQRQIVRQRLLFLAIVSGAILLLFFLCRRFTALFLQPVEESHRRQVQFVASASHELRTPLTVLTNCLSAMRRSDKEEREGFMRIMEKECFRMARLVADLLTLAGADSQGFPIRPSAVELDTLLLEQSEAFELLAHEKGIALTLRLPEEHLPPCRCDRERISQVLAILIQNALSYHRDEGEDRFIALSLKSSGRWFCLTVADNGPGIPDAQKEAVFERFYRCDPARRQKDHFGLGLSIAHEITLAHGGRLQLCDTKGGGASFLVWLPSVNR